MGPINSALNFTEGESLAHDKLLTKGGPAPALTGVQQ